VLAQQLDRREVWLEPWSDSDLELLRRNNVPEMMTYIGGPETEEQLVARHHRYLEHWRLGTARMFRVVIAGVPHGVGVVGYWDKTWRDTLVYESGWSIEPEFQGRGIAARAVAAALEHAARVGSRRYVHAFPSVENAASNALCRSVGFTLLSESDFEYPPGHMMRCNDWRFDLDELSSGREPA
jgi:RimJ/RimL family protein N-acetyltransferase